MDFTARRGQVIFIALLLAILIGLCLFMPALLRSVTGAPEARGGSRDPFFTPTPTRKATTIPMSATATSGVALLEANPAGGRPEILGGENCTYELEYWRTHPDSWPISGFTLGQLSLSAPEALSILESDPGEDLTLQLQRQLIVYTLNLYRGADPETVLPLIGQVRDWLDDYLQVDSIPEGDRQRGQALASSLAAFNGGLSGPARCPDRTDTPTPTVTPSSTATPTPTPTATPTATPAPILPTATRTPKSGTGPSQPPPPPTQPPPTPPPPTQPPPTNPPPPPTAVPTRAATPTPAP